MRHFVSTTHTAVAIVTHRAKHAVRHPRKVNQRSHTTAKTFTVTMTIGRTLMCWSRKNHNATKTTSTRWQAIVCCWVIHLRIIIFSAKTELIGINIENVSEGLGSSDRPGTWNSANQFKNLCTDKMNFTNVGFRRNAKEMEVRKDFARLRSMVDDTIGTVYIIIINC